MKFAGSLFCTLSTLFIVSISTPSFALDAGYIVTYAGNGTGTYLGDNVAPTSTGLKPVAVAADSEGNLYIVEESHYVRKISAATGVITTVAGNGSGGFSGDGGPATAASLKAPGGLAVDQAGNLYIADTGNSCIRKVTAATGVISTVAGRGGQSGLSGDGGLATLALLSDPEAVAVDNSQNIYIADTKNDLIRKVDAAGTISTVAGGGLGTAEGSPALQVEIIAPLAIAVHNGDLYLADGYGQVRKISAGIFTTVAGDGGVLQAPADNVPATQTTLDPLGLAIDSDANIYIADQFTFSVRKVTAATGIISTIAGNALINLTSGDNGPAIDATFALPSGIAMDGSGNFFIIDREGGAGLIRQVLALPAYTVTPGTGAGGAIFLNAPRLIISGRSATFTMLPDPGFQAELPMGGTCPQGSLDGTSYTTGIIVASCTLVPTFAANSSATVPDAPTNCSAGAGNGQATVTFSAPAWNGGSAITGYTVVSNPAGGVDTNAGSTTLSHLVTGLQNGTPYTFTVRASNGVGESAASAPSAPVIPATVPGAPVIGSATAGNGQAVVTFSAPADNGGSAITGYTVLSNPAGGVDTNAGSTTLSHLITGLQNGTAYTFTVSAKNKAGTGAASAATAPVIPATVPAPPIIGTVTAGDRQATVSFSAPTNNGGSAITGYTVVSSPAGGTDLNADSTALVHQITGLQNGTAYTFTVRAKNSIGVSAASAPSTAVSPATVPGAPVIGTVTAGDRQATVSFSAPTSNGGSAITGYTVVSSPAGGTDLNADSTALVHQITGLQNGTAYTFTVRAKNNIGVSAASAPSTAVIPATVPGAPVIGTVTAGDRQATVSFSAPINNGGSAITGYTVVSSPAGGTDLNADSTALVHQVTGLQNGIAYIFTVRAKNSIGVSAASGPTIAVVPATVPGAPIMGAVTPGDGQATVDFGAPANDGGSVITGYTVVSNPPGGVDLDAGSTSRSHLITALNNGTAYTFTVTASNRVGTGPASAPSSPVTLNVLRLLTVKIAGTGIGTVNSVSGPPLACSMPSCPQAFPAGATLQLSATASGSSIFSGWSGACTAASGNCTVTLTADQIVTASFTRIPPLMIPGAPSRYFDTLNDAMAAMSGSSLTLNGQAVSLTGGLILNRVMRLSFLGGFDPGFTSRVGNTRILGGLKVRSGTLVVKNVVVGPLQ